jgi:hypothetical protein
MVFTEFLEMVEETFSPDMVDTILDASDLSSGGAYTTLGTYDYAEKVQLVSHLSRETEVPVPKLLHQFGVHLFSRFVSGYPSFFASDNDAFGFLEKVEDYIHVEVRKLYADAELPTFEYEKLGADRLVMVYASSRPFGDLAEGLIQGCIRHFGGGIGVEREDLPDPKRTRVRFTLTRQPHD